MNLSLRISKNECFKGVMVGLVTMLLTLAIWELSLPQSHVKLISQMGHTSEPEQLKSALKFYFQDHADNSRTEYAGVSLQTLENEGYLPPQALVDVHPVHMRFHKSILAPSNTPSGQVWVEASLPSGERLVLLDDGSVQDAKQVKR